MKTYKTITEAFMEALPTCKSWIAFESGNVLDAKEMCLLCMTYDVNSPLEEDELYYVVFPDGEIDLINFNTLLVYKMFMPVGTPVEAAPARPRNFCTQCGAKLAEDSVFCENCGAKVV